MYLDFDKEHPNAVETPDGWKVEYLSMNNRPYDWETSGDFPAVKWKDGYKIEVISKEIYNSGRNCAKIN